MEQTLDPQEEIQSFERKIKENVERANPLQGKPPIGDFAKKGNVEAKTIHIEKRKGKKFKTSKHVRAINSKHRPGLLENIISNIIK